MTSDDDLNVEAEIERINLQGVQRWYEEPIYRRPIKIAAAILLVALVMFLAWAIVVAIG